MTPNSPQLDSQPAHMSAKTSQFSSLASVAFYGLLFALGWLGIFYFTFLPPTA